MAENPLDPEELKTKYAPTFRSTHPSWPDFCGTKSSLTKLNLSWLTCKIVSHDQLRTSLYRFGTLGNMEALQRGRRNQCEWQALSHIGTQYSSCTLTLRQLSSEYSKDNWIQFLPLILTKTEEQSKRLLSSEVSQKDGINWQQRPWNQLASLGYLCTIMCAVKYVKHLLHADALAC